MNNYSKEKICNKIHIASGIEVVSRLEEEKAAIEMGIKSVKLAIKNTKNNIERHMYLVDKGASTQRVYEQAQMEMVNYTKDLAKANVDLAKVKVQIARPKPFGQGSYRWCDS